MASVAEKTGVEYNESVENHLQESASPVLASVVPANRSRSGGGAESMRQADDH